MTHSTRGTLDKPLAWSDLKIKEQENITSLAFSFLKWITTKMLCIILRVAAEITIFMYSHLNFAPTALWT